MPTGKRYRSPLQAKDTKPSTPSRLLLISPHDKLVSWPVPWLLRPGGKEGKNAPAGAGAVVGMEVETLCWRAGVSGLKEEPQRDTNLSASRPLGGALTGCSEAGRQALWPFSTTDPIESRKPSLIGFKGHISSEVTAFKGADKSYQHWGWRVGWNHTKDNGLHYNSYIQLSTSLPIMVKSLSQVII